MQSSKPQIVIITPGTFPIPSHRSSSVETVVDKVSRVLSTQSRFYIVGKKERRLSRYATTATGITYVRPPFTKKASYLSRAVSLIRKLRPNLIQVENRPKFVPLLRRRFPSACIILSLHSTTYISQPHISRQQLAYSLQAASVIVVNSCFLKEYISNMFPWVMDNVFVNYLGVDTEQFRSRWLEEQHVQRGHFLHSLGYQNKKVILYVGRLVEIKGVHHLLKVMQEVIKPYPDAILVIVGSAYYGSNRLTPYVCELHQAGNRMPGNVRFIPFVPHDRIHEWFRIADMVVVPSSAQEAFGLVNVEAMASGIPVIATNAGGMKEIIEHGETGFLIDPKRMHDELLEKITTLLADESLVKRLGELSARRVQEKFTWRHTADRLNDLYRDQLGL